MSIKKPYHIINLSFAGIILAVFIYSGIFSADKNNHPIKCIHETITGKPCPACGLSNSFSEIIRGNFKKARLYNENGIPVFLFFLFQLILRFSTSFIYFKKILSKKILVTIDVIVSSVLFIITFNELLLFWKYLP